MKNIRNIYSLRKQQKRRGSFIAEFMGTWGLYALIGAIALAALGVAYSVFRGTNETDNITQIYTATLPLKSSRGGYTTGDLTEVLLTTNSIPTNMTILDNGTVQNSWGGAVTVTGVNGGANFEIEYGNVPSDQCVRMIQTLSNAGAFSAISTGGSQGNFQYTSGNWPISPSDANTACAGGSKTITFTSMN